MLRLAVLTTLRDAVAKEVDALRQTALGDLSALHDEYDVSQIKVTLTDDDDPVASVNLGISTPKLAVADRDQFTRWVKHTHPTELVETVRPAFEKALLGRLTVVNDQIVDKETGEIVDGIELVGGGSKKLTVNLSAYSGREKIAEAWNNGTLKTRVPLAIDPAALH